MEVGKIAGISIRRLKKTYRVAGSEKQVLNGMDLELDAGEITVILGRSGCGKTTCLRIVAGLEAYDGGEVAFEKTVRTGIVFQEPRLMPWLNVRKNIVFGLKKQEIDEAHVEELIQMTGLAGFEEAYPSQLSGGMQQRAALARALAYRASYLLMDEPFAALDHFTRQSMQQELLRIHQETSMGVLFVTHSIEEALILGDKIVILDQGKTAKQYEIRNQPYPRDLLSEDMIEIQRNIIKTIKGDNRL